MKKQSHYAAPDIFVEQFVCEEGVFASPYATFDGADGLNDEFEDTASATSYEVFFYGNMNE